MNELEHAARNGSAERTVAVLSRGVIDIDQGTSDGCTPLMFAATYCHNRVVQILLNKGANASKVDDEGGTALHCSSQRGHLAATKLLVKAGADLEAKTYNFGSSPLNQAALAGHLEIMEVLIEAGANPNSHRFDGVTPLYLAAQEGHVNAIKLLIRAKASPLLAATNPQGTAIFPLDVAAYYGHLEVARELIQEHGIEGCGGASGGVAALGMAAQTQHVEMMGMLISAGVVDTGRALVAVASLGRESSVKFLLQQWKASDQGAAYLDTLGKAGRTPLICSIEACRSCSPRITRLLVDAGADPAKAVRLKDARVVVLFAGTPLALVDYYLREKTMNGKDATESQLHSLEGTRRLLLRVEAVMRSLGCGQTTPPPSPPLLQRVRARSRQLRPR